MKTPSRNLIVILASTLIALFLAEIGLRAMEMYAPPVLRPARRDLYQADAHVGYRLWRSTRTCDRYPVDNPEVIPLTSNADGFRNSREYGETDDRPGVLVVGDSFVFGSGVRAEDRLTEVLESLEPRWRVDNLGMGGWGVDLMIRALERFADRIQPEVVALAVYTDDFRRLTPYYSGVGYPIPKFELQNGESITVPYPMPVGLRRLRIYQAVVQSYWRSTRFRDRYDLNRALLDRFLALSQEFEFEPVVMFLPGRLDTPVDQQRRGFLRDWSEQNTTPFLDLTEPIHGSGVENVYIPDNFHWNARGHEVAARALLELLRENSPELSSNPPPPAQD